jgi:hypothetical protein
MNINASYGRKVTKIFGTNKGKEQEEEDRTKCVLSTVLYDGDWIAED